MSPMTCAELGRPDMNELRQRLQSGPLLLLDGGLGTELIARGLPPGSPPELWTIERPEVLVAVHRSYVEAGSEVVHANTFGANAVRLACFGLAGRCAEINKAAVHLARDSGARYVFADIGPTGQYLPPVGQGNPEIWRRAYLEQAEILASSGCDALHLETMSDLREALLALAAVKEAAPNLPVLVSLTFERKKRGFFTIMGDPLNPSLGRLAEEGAAAVGANCNLTSKEMSLLAREAIPVVAAPLVFQPNAGAPEIRPEGIRYARQPEEFASDLAALGQTVGASDAPSADSRAPGIPRPGRVAALGGCCGTDPRFISALYARVRRSRAL